MKRYQAVIVGFGKAGKTLARKLAMAGWKVALIEQSEKMYGGTCINIGCIPTKTLIHEAQQKSNFADAMKRKDNVVRTLRDKNYHNLSELENIDIIIGKAEFINKNKIKITRGIEIQEIISDKIFINTGSVPVFPDIPGLEDTNGILDSTEILNLTKLPETLGILGGGYIGVEFASMFASFGSQVTIFESGSEFLPREDRDIANSITDILKNEGIEIELSSGVTSVSSENGKIIVNTATGVKQVDVLLVASGRKPATEHLCLENAGVNVNERGAIIVDKHLKTSVDNIWAMGDVTGGLQFTYISLDDYRIVYDSLLGEGKRSTEDRVNVPYSVFMTPTLSRIGVTEKQAKENGIDFQVATMPVAAIPRSRVINDMRGLLKIIVDNKSKNILGAALLCAESHEMINVIKTIMDSKLPYTVLRDQIFTHPTMCESLNDLLALIK